MYSVWTDKVKAWDNGVPMDEGTRQQVMTTASLPEIVAVALMPDGHVGSGSTVGSVIVTKKVILPAAVGVDLGCGVMAVRTSLDASDLPDNLDELRQNIERAVPFGRSDQGGAKDVGSWNNREIPAAVNTAWAKLEPRFNSILEKHPKIGNHNARTHLCSGGSGNHYLELCIDENGSVWLMLHSGSRGVGNRIGQYFINKAKEEMQIIGRGLPDPALAFLSRDTTVFDDYVEAMTWAQDFAMENRRLMMKRALEVLRNYKKLPSFNIDKAAINCHHNYVSFETHLGEKVIVTRKGAVNAENGRLGIIPGSMGTGSFIVRGLGNEESFCSCSHGAGRVMSRTQAKKLITMEDHEKAMVGISARRDADVLDESPAAYKDINAVMAAQSDLIEIQHRLRQVLNIKG